MTTLQLAPEIGELLDLPRQVSLARCQKDGVDGTGGDAGDDLESEVREVTGQPFQQAHLIRRPRPTTGEHHRQVSTRRLASHVRRNAEFRYHAAQPFQAARQRLNR